MDSITSFAEGHGAYEKVYKLGKKEGSPVESLDDLLKAKGEQIVGEYPLGVVQIPSELIVGTKTNGRSSALSKSFYPLLKPGSEFANKWIALYRAHMDEGIREPIKAYEYMNKFYVEEGNKRVSVLKCCGAVSIPGNVIRLIPRRTNDPENMLYYEFIDFYNLSGINYISFTKPGSYARLQQLVGKRPDELWSDDDKLDFSSIFARFSLEFEAIKTKGGSVTPGDAFLFFIGLYDYRSLFQMTTSELKKTLLKAKEEFNLLQTSESVELQMTPNEDNGNALNKTINKTINKVLTDLIPSTRQTVAFIHQKTAETSGWTYGHELGRLHLDEVFADEIETVSYFNATEENADALLEQAIAAGADIIFTTAPPLLKASLKAALEHPNVKILNCSLNASHKSIRTYYARMYEAKFLMGAIAGAMSVNGKVGYIADYPIYGMTANINAFALGAKMVNPKAKVYLEWSTLKDQNIAEKFSNNNVTYISGLDIVPPKDSNRHFGLYRSSDRTFLNLAVPVWNWGIFYEKMINNILNGTWKFDEASASTKGLNYWWGMSSEIIDVICSRHLPIGTARLIDLLKNTICRGEFNPFSGILYSQQGLVQKDAERVMTPEEIIEMDWLAENVIGYIPKMEDLIDQAKPVVSKSGLENSKS
ncbi:MAG: BMP family ABC transporter substrate-binding protein [Clostridiales bacterium]|nr:BMP family ABC transporter substrate-binding protein [Candidatus Blautia equi]